jgi:lysophospholipase L1-like esterase
MSKGNKMNFCSSFVSLENKNFIRFNFEIKLRHVLLLLSFLYLAWEIYWAKKVGYAIIKWHTHLALYFFTWMILAFVLRIFHRFIHLHHHMQIQTTLASVCISMLISESVLVYKGIGDTYMEHINAGYASRYNSTYESYYRTHKPNERFYITRPEFNYVRQCNSLGFSDVEWRREKSKSEKRILICGDSFTEGVGAPFDSCYPSLLRNLLAAEDSNYCLMNSGIAGDDPCVNYVNYRDRLVAYHPDLIIQTLSSNDVNTDIAVKGGLERFQKDGKVQLPPAPWWEPIYALSYVARAFFTALGYNELLIKIPFSTDVKDKLDKKTVKLFKAYAKEVGSSGAKLIVVLQPNQGEVVQQHYDCEMEKIIPTVQPLDNIFVIDLLPYYSNEFANSKDSIGNYYWKQDGHHNSKGYFLMAKGVKQAIDSFNSSVNE